MTHQRSGSYHYPGPHAFWMEPHIYTGPLTIQGCIQLRIPFQDGVSLLQNPNRPEAQHGFLT